MKSKLMCTMIFLACFLGSTVQAWAASVEKKETPKTALLIIDVQEFYFSRGGMPLERPEAASLNVKKILTKFRKRNQLVIHVGHRAKKGASFHTDALPQKGEKIIMKDEVSAFNGTDLLKVLKKNKIRRLVICGMQTHMCVEAAARAAHDLGFDCILVHDACATRTLKFGDSVISAADVHNATLSTLDHAYATVVDTATFLRTY
ncbi:MAG: cysteine hydrolase [Proteobacteria bacterium]|nr:cysteine hydrolase [Pseudomonadota bacterium]